jgi:hypothetical protein
MQDVPGGSSGLLIRDEHAIGAGRNAGRAVEYRVNVALLAEQRALLKQMAQEQSESTRPADELSGPRSRASLIILPEKHPYPVLIPPLRSSAEAIDDAE